jgi:flagellar secretion chaperone FliS
MPSSVRDSYLETEVMTATPQKLQYMLLDAAILAIQKTKRSWASERDDEACETLIRAQQIMSELLCGLNREVDSDLAKKVAAIYLFVLRNLMDAHARKDVQKLDGALDVLEIERETWRRVCEELGSTSAPDGPKSKIASPEAPVGVNPAPADFTSGPGMVSDTPGGFSIEA